MPKILIVEDSPDNMRLFRTLLTMKGHEVVGLAGGDGLLETLERDRPELVLMDIQLPGKDGFRLLAEIQGFFLALAVLCGEDDDRQRCGPHLCAKLFQDAEAISPSSASWSGVSTPPATSTGPSQVSFTRLSPRSAWTVLALR